MFDTHCHLNFKSFDGVVDSVIFDAQNIGVTYITIPGTDLVSSQKAIDSAQKHTNIFAAVGIHPHHVFEHMEREAQTIEKEISVLEKLLNNKKVVAIGEIGLDRHMYQKTKYGEYVVEEKFIQLQKQFFVAQIELAKKYKKSVIVHNREAKQDLLPLLNEYWDSFFEGRMVLHCCEPDKQLLSFVKEKKIFWGVDGDVTYYKEKADFIPRVPLDQLVLETDSPFLLPEPLKSQKKYPNTPVNLPLIANYLAKLRGENPEVLKKQTEENGRKLFQID